MNWFKENPILSSILLVCLLVMIGISYFAVDASSTYNAAREALDSQVKSFSSLQKKSPYPTEDNLTIISDGKKKYTNALKELRKQMSEMQAPLEENISPQVFQDKLREGVNDLRKTAQSNNIKLPEKFFFGFDEYQSLLPSAEAAPVLNRDFEVVQKLLQKMLSLKGIKSINILEREVPLILTPNPTPTPSPKKSTETPHKPQILVTKFKISFTAPEKETREALNMIAKGDSLLENKVVFLIIRSLTLENTKPSAPSKKDPQSSIQDKSPTSLQVLLGAESVKSDLTLEIVDFPSFDSSPTKQQ